MFNISDTTANDMFEQRLKTLYEQNDIVAMADYLQRTYDDYLKSHQLLLDTLKTDLNLFANTAQAQDLLLSAQADIKTQYPTSPPSQLDIKIFNKLKEAKALINETFEHMYDLLDTLYEKLGSYKHLEISITKLKTHITHTVSSHQKASLVLMMRYEEMIQGLDNSLTFLVQEANKNLTEKQNIINVLDSYLIQL